MRCSWWSVRERHNTHCSPSNRAADAMLTVVKLISTQHSQPGLDRGFHRSCRRRLGHRSEHSGASTTTALLAATAALIAIRPPWQGSLTAVRALLQFFLLPSLGSAADVFGRRPVLAASYAVCGLEFSILCFGGPGISMSTVWFTRSMTGLMDASLTVPYAIIADLSQVSQWRRDHDRTTGIVHIRLTQTTSNPMNQPTRRIWRSGSFIPTVSPVLHLGSVSSSDLLLVGCLPRGDIAPSLNI